MCYGFGKRHLVLITVSLMLVFQNGHLQSTDDKRSDIDVSKRAVIPGTQDYAADEESEDCVHVPEVKDDSIASFGEEYGKLSNKLATFLDGIKIDDLATVLFVGNTGAGKSTLVQLLAGDNYKMISKEVSSGTGDYIIEDENDLIGTTTVESKTLYPELLLDLETNIILCDNPGFHDTRSPSHEIVAAYSIKRVIDKSKRVKIALVVVHSSLKKGQYRTEFTNLLKQLHLMIKDVDKFKDSIFLIATKVDNNYRFMNGVITIVPKDVIIRTIAEFLQEIKSFYTDKIAVEEENTYLKSAIKIIDILLTKDNNTFTRINIVRTPNTPGRVSEIKILQNNRESIRSMLLEHKNFIRTTENDIGIAISETAKLFLTSFFQNINNYISNNTNLFATYISQYYIHKFEKDYELNQKIEDITCIKTNVETLSTELGKCHNPKEYVATVKQFLMNNKIKVCSDFLNKIIMYDSHLGNLINLSKSETYAVELWASKFSETERLIENELKFNLLLRYVFELLKGYEFQKNKHLYNVAEIERWGIPGNEQGLKINEGNFLKFLNKIKISEFNEVKLNEAKLQKLNTVIGITLQSSTTSICKDETLIIFGNFVLMRDVIGYLGSCYNSKSIVVEARHMVIFDVDLEESVMAARSLKIVAPMWRAIGRRRISLDGRAPEGKLAKAGYGEIGLDGRDGNNGGSFLGVGMRFKNAEELTVSAHGGRGQDGQDGGDGAEGEQGVDDWKEVWEYDRHLIKGKRGTPGGNAGSGGYGGKGGKAGRVEMQFVGHERPSINIVATDGPGGSKGIDGRPGRGGFNGCDKEIVTKRKFFLGIRIKKWNEIINLPCDRTNPNGILNYVPRKINPWSQTTKAVPEGHCFKAVSDDKDYFNILVPDLVWDYPERC